MKCTFTKVKNLTCFQRIKFWYGMCKIQGKKDEFASDTLILIPTLPYYIEQI